MPAVEEDAQQLGFLGLEEETELKPVCQVRQVLVEFSSINILYSSMEKKGEN